MSEQHAHPEGAQPSRNLREVFLVFLGLGLTSFGGPIAHLGYFERAFVARRGWLSAQQYAGIVALFQMMPGPTSSQVGMAIGKHRAGIAGSVVAWLGFTFPSALALGIFAFVVERMDDVSNAGWLHGLKLTAVAIVAQAVWSMWRNLAPDRDRSVIAVVAAIVILLWVTVASQLLVLAAGGVIGFFYLTRTVQPDSGAVAANVGSRQSHRFAALSLGVFAVLFGLLPLLNRWTDGPLVALADLFYRAGSLVFGGGHAVLPLLQAELVPDFVTNDQFLAGYGAAQAVPGPLFTFSTYIGATSDGVAGAFVATIAIFLPSFLLVWGIMPYWERIGRRPELKGALLGINAAVVGVLVAALYDPIFTTAVHDREDAAAAIGLFGLLQFLKAPPWVVVIVAIGIGLVFW